MVSIDEEARSLSPQKGLSPESAAIADDGPLGFGDGFPDESVVAVAQLAVAMHCVGEFGEIGEVVAFAEARAEPVDAGVEFAGLALLGQGDEFALVTEPFHGFSPVVPPLGVEAALRFAGVAPGAAEAAAQFVPDRAAKLVGIGIDGGDGVPSVDLREPVGPQFGNQAFGAGSGTEGFVVVFSQQGGYHMVEREGDPSVVLSRGQGLGEAGKNGKVADAGKFGRQLAKGVAAAFFQSASGDAAHQPPSGSQAFGGDAHLVDGGLVRQRPGRAEPAEAISGDLTRQLAKRERLRRPVLGGVGHRWGGSGFTVRPNRPPRPPADWHRILPRRTDGGRRVR